MPRVIEGGEARPSAVFIAIREIARGVGFHDLAFFGYSAASTVLLIHFPFIASARHQAIISNIQLYFLATNYISGGLYLLPVCSWLTGLPMGHGTIGGTTGGVNAATQHTTHNKRN